MLGFWGCLLVRVACCKSIEFIRQGGIRLSGTYDLGLGEEVCFLQLLLELLHLLGDNGVCHAACGV